MEPLSGVLLCLTLGLMLYDNHQKMKEIGEAFKELEDRVRSLEP